MAVNRIDLVKLPEVSQYKHMETQRLQHAQDVINQNFQHLVEQQHQKPQGTTKPENPELHYDAKEKGSNEYYSSGNKKKKEKKEDKRNAMEPPKSGGFDIKI
jgi:hypothetical protein